jgi:CHAD domain-containing protein
MGKPKTPPMPKKSLKKSFEIDPIERRSQTIGEFISAVIDKQYQHTIAQEQGVLADKDPEYLHQMRVGSRRLSTALQVFSHAVALPKASREKQVRSLTKALGALRDLDVQIASVRENFYPRVNSAERKMLDKVLESLEKQRKQAFAEVESILNHPSYEKLKAAYETWLGNPQFSSPVHFYLGLLLPDLLSPLLSTLLLHPGWSIPVCETSEANSSVLHDLRKTCKYVRYQAEFFTDFYDTAFKGWLDELKELQDSLGKVQDMYVLQALLLRELPEGAELPELQRAIQDDLIGAMANWEPVRQKYLNSDFRYQLHQMILEPLMKQIGT